MYEIIVVRLSTNTSGHPEEENKISKFGSGVTTHSLLHSPSFLLDAKISFQRLSLPSPRCSGDLSSYKDVYRREAIGFSQPPSSTPKKPPGNEIRVLYTRTYPRVCTCLRV